MSVFRRLSSIQRYHNLPYPNRGQLDPRPSFTLRIGLFRTHQRPLYSARLLSVTHYQQRRRSAGACPLWARSGHWRSLSERGNGGFSDLVAPLLDEVTAVGNLEWRGTPAYLLTQCCPHPPSPDGGFYPPRPGRLSPPPPPPPPTRPGRAGDPPPFRPPPHPLL